MFDERIKNLYVVNPEIEGLEVVFYGAGDESHTMYRNLVRSGHVRLKGIYDKNLCGEEQWGVSIMSRDAFERLDKNIPIIIATRHMQAFQEMVHDCFDLGFENIITKQWPVVAAPYVIQDAVDKILSAKREIDFCRNLFADEKSKKVFDTILQYRVTNDFRLLLDIRESYKQYFPMGEIFSPAEKEVFIDGGSYNAQTIRDLKEWTNDKYEKAYAFEPSEEDYVVTKEMIDFYGYRAEPIGAGLYDENGTVKFVTTDMGLSTVKSDGDIEIKVIRLDDFAEEREKITFLKLDIEGSEFNALRGAYKCIKRDFPKLAICVYHKFDDLWNIPIWINKHFPEYKLYLRHHSVTDNETVLYAKCDE